jgi:hypothetical protein
MPFPAVQTTSLDSLIASTLQNYGIGMVDNIIKSVPLAHYLMDEHARKSQGGTRIYIPLLYGFNSTVTTFNMSDYIDVAPQEAITAAQFKWANIVGAITLFGEEEAANSGQAVITDLARAKIRQLEMSLARYINQISYLDGTGSFGANPDGLANLVFQTSTPANPPGGSVGGVDATVFPFWRNNANLAPGSFAANGPHGTGVPDNMLRMYNLCSDGSIRPTFILSDSGVFESYQTNASTALRVLDQKSTDLAFDNIMYKGVPWAWDRDCPAATQYFLNTEFIYTVVDPGRFFQQTPWMPTINQDGKVLRIHLRFNNVCSNRMLQGVLAGWTA